MAKCNRNEIVDAIDKSGIRLSPVAFSHLRNSDSNVNFKDILPTSETLTSLGSEEFNDIINRMVTEDYMHDEYNPSELDEDFVDGYYDTMETIENFYKSLDNPDKIRLKMFDSQSGTSGSYNITDDKSIDEISILRDTKYKMANQSEILLHELIHKVAKSSFKVNSKIKLKIGDLKDIVNEFNHDHSFLLRDIENPSEDMIADAKRKHKYIFSNESDPEEFLAYYVSNKYVQNMVNTLTKDYSNNTETMYARKPARTRDKDLKGISKVSDLLGTVFDSIGSQSNLPTPKGRRRSKIGNSESVLNDVVSDLIEFRTKMIHTSDNKTFKNLMDTDNYLGGMIPSIIRDPAMVAGSIIDKLHDYGMKTYDDRFKEKLTSMLEGLKVHLSSATLNINSKLDGLKRVDAIKRLIESRFMVDLYRQFFMSESTGNYKDYSNISRASNLSRNISEQLRDRILSKSSELDNLDEPLRTDAKDVLVKVLRNGVFRYGKYILDGELSSDRISESLDKVKSLMSNNELSAIEDISLMVRFQNDKTSSSKETLISVRNIGNRHNIESVKRLEQYASLLALQDNFSEADYDTLNLLSESQLKEQTLSLLKTYKNQYRNIEDLYTSSEYTSLPFGYTTEDKGSEKRRVSYMIESEANELLSTASRVKKIGNKTYNVFGVKMVKVSVISNSPSFSDGLLKTSSSSVDGTTLSSIIRKSLKSKESIFKIKSEKKKEKENSTIESNVDDILSSIINKDEEVISKIGFDIDTFIPKLDSRGKTLDFIIPISNSDRLSHSDADVNFSSIIANSMYSMNDIKASISENNKTIDKLKVLNSYIRQKDNLDGTKTEWVKISSIEGYDGPASQLGEDDPLYIPKHLVPMILGATQSSLANLSIMGLHIDKSSIKNIIMLSEKILTSFSSKYKQTIALLEPDVILGNFRSNMLVALEKGISPVKFAKSFQDNWEDMNKFQKLLLKRDELFYNESIELDEDDRDLISEEIANVSYAIKNHGMYSLYVDGQVSLSMEDVDTSETGIIRYRFDKKFYTKEDDNYMDLVFNEAQKLRGDSNDQLSSFIEEAERNIKKSRIHVPMLMKNISKVLYVDSGTTVAKKSEKLLLYSDAITKKVILDDYREKFIQTNNRDLTAIEERQMLSSLAELFVSYSTSETGVQKWLENVAMFHFQKYQFRSIKGYIKHMIENPVKSLTSQVGQVVTGINLDDPLDSNFNQGPLDAWSSKQKSDDLLDVMAHNASPHLFNMFSAPNNWLYKDFHN